MRSRLPALFLSALAVAATALGAGASAQCLGPDGFTASCCTPVTPNLPTFPGQSHPGLGVCWNACQPGAGQPLKVSLGAPTPIACAQYSASIKVDDGSSGASLLSGSVQLDYTRTWMEGPSSSGTDTQVWRFVAKADLRPSVLPPPLTCPVSSCLLSHPTAFFYGYVDYAFDCTTSQWTGAIVLYHACDWFIHRPGVSDKPGAFHPGTSYGIIAPHTTANPFVPALLPAPGGPLLAEAVRDVSNPLFPGCVAEEFVSGGALTPLASICVCPLTPLPAQHTASKFTGVGSCPGVATGAPSSWTSLNTLGFGLPWLELMTTSLGMWTTGASYPGPEQVFVNEGLVFYHDACGEIPGATNGNSFDILYGATTAGGFAVLPDPVFLLTDKMIDVASNFSLRLGSPPIPPFVGSVRKTDHLIYVNVP